MLKAEIVTQESVEKTLQEIELTKIQSMRIRKTILRVKNGTCTIFIFYS